MAGPQEMIRFLDDEIRGLRGRIGTTGNAVQHAKLAMLLDLRALVASLSENRRASA